MRGGESKWRPLAGELRRQIADGELKPGSRPSIGRIQRESGMSRTTIAKAFRALEGEGLLERRRGLGYTVAEPPGTLSRAEVAALFRVGVRAVTRWAAAGKITSIRTGSTRRYLASDVEELLRGGAS